MALNTVLFGRKRDAARDTDVQIHANELSELLVAQGLPAGAEATRKGKRWSMMSVAAVAGLVVRPSTTAALEIYNGYPAGGKSLIIERVFWHQLVSVTGVPEAYVGYAMVTLAKAAPTAQATALVKGHNGGSYGGSVIGGFSTTVVDNGWYPWAVNPGHAAITGTAGGFGAIGEVTGRIIVPPGSSLCLHALANTVGQTFTQGAEWIEEVISNE